MLLKKLKSDEFQVKRKMEIIVTSFIFIEVTLVISQSISKIKRFNFLKLFVWERGRRWIWGKRRGLVFGASNESYISSITFNDAILKITKERRAGSVNSFWYFSKYYRRGLDKAWRAGWVCSQIVQGFLRATLLNDMQ